MDLRKISAILLFSLVVPIVMNYRIYPMQGTPYILFGILFISFIGFTVLSIKGTKKLEVFRGVLFWLILAVGLGGATVTAIVDRHRVAPVWGVHDIILQQEQAIRYLVNGKNPYKETYFGTPVEMFHYDELGKDAVNPALYHFVMPPWYLLFPLPFYVVSNQLFGYFDGRMVMLFLLVCTFVILRKWFKNKYLSELAVILISVSPAVVDYFIEGRSDFFAFALLIFSLFLFDKGKYTISIIMFSLAMLSKQTIWFAFPLYIFLLWKKTVDWRLKSREGRLLLQVDSIFLIFTHKRLVKFFSLVFLAFLTILFFVSPFLIWDAKAYIESTILYLSAGGEKGYPVSGYGLSMIFYQLGILKDLHEYYPFYLWQFLFGIPSMLMSFYWLNKSPKLSVFLYTFAITLFSFWYTSRYFNNSHISVIASLFALGVLRQADEDEKRNSTTEHASIF